jgi:hypothetical protein
MADFCGQRVLCMQQIQRHSNSALFKYVMNTRQFENIAGKYMRKIRRIFPDMLVPGRPWYDKFVCRVYM